MDVAAYTVHCHCPSTHNSQLTTFFVYEVFHNVGRREPKMSFRRRHSLSLSPSLSLPQLHSVTVHTAHKMGTERGPALSINEWARTQRELLKLERDEEKSQVSDTITQLSPQVHRLHTYHSIVRVEWSCSNAWSRAWCWMLSWRLSHRENRRGRFVTLRCHRTSVTCEDARAVVH